MSKYKITNKKIMDFYDANESLDFQTMNLIFIDILQQIKSGLNSTINSTINTQILSEISDIRENINNINNSFYIKLQENKKDTIEEYKNILYNNLSQNNEKLGNLIQQNTTHLLDKTTILLNDVLPKSNENQFNFFKESISNFQKTISEDSEKILQSINKEEQLNNFLNNFENKYNQLIQPFCTIVNASEERLHKEISYVKNSQLPESLMNNLTDFFNKYKNSSYKGQLGEMQLETVLNQIFPSAEVLNTTSIKASCDFKVNRIDKETILFETKDYDRNVTLDEVKKFIRDIEIQKTHGVFLSQHSGITSKQNFQIDMIGKNIVIYIHNVNYEPTIIKMTVDIIDNLNEKLLLLDDNENNDFTISDENLQEINKEYANFIQQKLKLIDIIKDFNKNISYQIENIKFPCLSKLITQKCGSILNNENTEIICNICNKFSATSNKSLAAHQRACKKNFKQDSIVIN